MSAYWSTQDARRNEQFDYWHDVICEAFLPLEPIRTEPAPFEGSVAAVALRQFQLASVTANAHTVTRTRRGISRLRTGGFFANLIRSGSAEAAQAGNCALAAAGDIVLLDTDEPFEFRMFGTCDVVCLTIPEYRLRSRLAGRGYPASPVVSARTAAGRLASRYLLALSSENEDELLDLEYAAFDHLCDLLIHDAAPPACARDTKRARIAAYIDEHLGDRDLSVDSTCRALGLSRSYLYALMAESGLSFAAEVRRRRLIAVDRDLCDPRYAKVTLAELAFRYGFDDPSGFSRSYRSLFATTPKARRQESLVRFGT